MNNVVVLGSTGSIGVNALDALRRLGRGWRAYGLAANSSLPALRRQVAEFKPAYVALFDEAARAEYARELPRGVKLLAPGVEGLEELAALPAAGTVLSSVTGAVGFTPLLAALRAGKKVALANKEPMVMAGALLRAEAARHGASLIPVDSEPAAVFQCLAGTEPARWNSLVRRVFLTASGGPFYRRKGSLGAVTPRLALRHPRWSMGPKITVDSATLMNKGLEAIEIQHLFGLDFEKIEVVVHPQSVVHSAVEFGDGSVLAQLSRPDMRLPIQYALTWPERRASAVEPLDLFKLARLDFARPDFRRFPCLELARAAALKGNIFPAALSAADEVAVGAFLAGRIKFTAIPRVVEKVLAACRPVARFTLAAALQADAWARAEAARAAGVPLKR